MENLLFEVTGKPTATNIFVLVNSVGTARRLEQKLEFLANLILDRTVVFFFVQGCSLRLPEILSSLAIDWVCRQMHLPHATFSHEQSLHSTDDMCAWLKFELRPKRGFHPRVMFHFAPHSVEFVDLSDSRLVVHASIYPRKIHGRMALPRNSTLPQVMSPKGSSSTGPCFNLSNQRFDCHDGIEEIGVKPLSYSQSLIHSTIRQRALQRHWTRTSKTNKYVRCWLHHCIPKYQGNLMQKVYRSEKQMHNEHKACHSRRETLMTSSSRDLKVSGKPDAVLSCHTELGPNTFSERNQRNEPGNRFENSVHSVFRVAEPSSAGKSLLDGHKDHLLNQARSELMKQEYQVGSLNNCINELRQQAYAQKLELEDAHHGYVESRREQVRLRYERKSSSRRSDSKYARDERNEESSRTTSRRILCAKIERKS